ncbi:hypothetical protein KM043_001840 [Ampulex compressa]|nr:hypothetical protein KM043_001840 [Ampulex compressa]
MRPQPGSATPPALQPSAPPATNLASARGSSLPATSHSTKPPSFREFARLEDEKMSEILLHGSCYPLKEVSRRRFVLRPDSKPGGCRSRDWRIVIIGRGLLRQLGVAQR